MNHRRPNPEQFYVAGGTLKPDAPSYVERAGDRELWERLREGEYCYVLTPRQMGKSSLMARTARRLRDAGQRAAVVDVTQLGTEKGRQAADAWYYGIVYRIHRDLGLRTPLKPWWQGRSELSAVQRLVEYFREVVLTEGDGRVVVFVDEIDSTLGLPFTDDFFAAIRACYNAGATDEAFERLSFVLLGVASPDQLIRDPARTPFNLGRRVELTDFTAEEAAVLAPAVADAEADQKALLAAILGWTGGHPYLTQLLCRLAAANDGESAEPREVVDGIVRDRFLSPRALREETNLKHTQARLTAGGRAARRRLKRYRKIRIGAKVADKPMSRVCSELKLSGVVKVTSDGMLQVRNKIYETVFNPQWVKLEMPSDLTRQISWSAVAATVVALIAWYAYLVPQTYLRQIENDEGLLAAEAHAELRKNLFFSDRRADKLYAQYWERRAFRFREADDREQEIECYSRAIALLRASGEMEEVARLLNEIGSIYRALGQLQESLAAYRELLGVLKIIKEPQWEAHALNNLTDIHRDLGHANEALISYQQIIEIYHFLEMRPEEANALYSLGRVYNSLGKPHEALDRLEAALALLSSIPDPKKQAQILAAMATAHELLQDHAAAIHKLERALKLYRQIGEPLGEARTLDALGTAYREMGDIEGARASFLEALSIWQRFDYLIGIAKTTSELGWLYIESDQPDRALEYFQRALPMLSALHDSDGETHAHMGIAHILRQRGDLAIAQEHLEKALEIIESVRDSFDRQDLRSSFVALRHECYELYIDLLMELHDSDTNAGYDALALEARERARARRLLELLIENGADIRQGVPAELVVGERSLREQMNHRATQWRQRFAAGASAEELAALEKDQRDLGMQFEELQALMRLRSPRYAAFARLRPPTAQEVRQLLDDETILLVYSLGQQRSYLWLVTPEAINCYKLPARSAIEEQARRTSHWLRNSDRRFGRYGGFRAAVELSNMLVGPVARQLGTKRVLVVSDGILEYIPFGSLPTPGNAGAASYRQAPPLIVDHEVVSLPSASVLMVLSQRSAEREKAPKTVAVVADPVFTADDPRVGASQEEAPLRQTGDPAAELGLAAQWGLTSFERLLFSRREAEAILDLVPAEQSLRALDFDANRDTVFAGRLSGYRIIHFATHAMLYEEDPKHSALMLSLVDEHGRHRDGRLYMHELYSLNLGADLVVLSACRTGPLRDRGEGLVGLTWGFMYAGAAAVLASLWNVDDRATAELMAHFYQGMLGEGLGTAAALRKAQRTMHEHRNKRWRAPRYWAGFVLQGRWQ